jgi:hypothetical protein
MASKWRFGILLGGSLLLLIAAVLELVASLQSGVAALPFGRRGAVIQFTQTDSPLAFYLCVAIFAAFALAVLWYASRQVRALLAPSDPDNERFIRERIAEVERSAPSGLRPLWVGLLLFAAVLFVLWVFAE